MIKELHITVSTMVVIIPSITALLNLLSKASSKRCVLCLSVLSYLIPSGAIHTRTPCISSIIAIVVLSTISLLSNRMMLITNFMLKTLISLGQRFTLLQNQNSKNNYKFALRRIPAIILVLQLSLINYHNTLMDTLLAMPVILRYYLPGIL